MKYTKKDMGSYNLHMIKTNKFKTISVKVIFRRKIKKEEITIRNFLIDILSFSCNKYNTRKKMSIETQELYAASISTANTRTGNYFNTSFNLNVLNDKYTEEGNFKKALEFFNEIIFNPDVKDKKFKEKVLNIIKTSARTTLNSIKENPASYASIRAMEVFDESSPASYRMNGYIEDIDDITVENLYEYYQDMIRNDLVDIFVVGDFNEDELIKNIKAYFKLKVVKKKREDYLLDIKKVRSRKLIEKEQIENSQSHVNVICRIAKMSDYERQYVLPVFNLIYGGGSDGKLFKIVREKHSLCYSIASRSVKYDHLLIIKTAINKENFDKSTSLIEKILNDMKKGKFTNTEIEIAKKILDTALDETEESAGGIIDYYMALVFTGIDDIDTARKIIEKVSKNEIVKLAKKVNIDTIYMLEGDKNEETGD